MTRIPQGQPTEADLHHEMKSLQYGIETALNRLGQIRRFGFVMVVYDKDDVDQHYYVSSARPKLSKNLLQHLIEEIDRQETLSAARTARRHDRDRK